MTALGELHRRTARSDGSVLCHGDLHRANLLWDGAQATLLDWGNAHREAPLADLARLAARPSPEAPGCDLPTGEAAELALALYHKQGPLAHLSWSEFLARHREATQHLLQQELALHQQSASKAPTGMRPWIELQVEQIQRQLDHLRL
jgi:aminoglycoside phosphotransferase (APT) family kinase protein